MEHIPSGVAPKRPCAIHSSSTGSWVATFEKDLQRASPGSGRQSLLAARRPTVGPSPWRRRALGSVADKNETPATSARGLSVGGGGQKVVTT